MSEQHHQKEKEASGDITWLKQEVGSSEANGLISLETEELETYQKQFQDLELQLERNISSHLWQIPILEGRTDAW